MVLRRCSHFCAPIRFNGSEFMQTVYQTMQCVIKRNSPNKNPLQKRAASDKTDGKPKKSINLSLWRCWRFLHFH